MDFFTSPPRWVVSRCLQNVLLVGALLIMGCHNPTISDPFVSSLGPTPGPDLMQRSLSGTPSALPAATDSVAPVSYELPDEERLDELPVYRGGIVRESSPSATERPQIIPLPKPVRTYAPSQTRTPQPFGSGNPLRD